MATTRTALAGIRVINIGTAWAGRVASMLLAEQGADVIEIVRPGRAAHPCDPLLNRGKRLLELNLRDTAGHALARRLMESADVVFENMRAGAASALELDHASLPAQNRVVYVSMPGFAHGDENRDLPAWEGVIDATCGIYTDISTVGSLLGGDPIYSAIPMASAYGGVHGALAATLALFHRQRHGRGQRIEVPLADAVMSAVALLIARIEGQPERYNSPPLSHDLLEKVFPLLRQLREHLSDDQVAEIVSLIRSRTNPGMTFYECADGRQIFMVAMDHGYQTRAFLETVGVYDQLIAEGMVDEGPYSEDTNGNNINNAAHLTPARRKRLLELIAARIRTRPAKDWERLLRTANVPITVVQTDSEWLSDPQLLAGGVITDLEDDVSGTVRQPGRFISIDAPSLASPELHSGTSVTAADWLQPPVEVPAATAFTAHGMLQGVRVLDLSNVVAGPAAGRTLAEHGAEVTRIDPPSPLAGPRLTMWFGLDVNQGKRALVLDLKTARGRDVFARLVEQSDVVLHNFLDRSAQSLGIAHEQLAAINPDIVSCQVSAWGGSRGGPLKDDPAFDPVLQAASGIMARYGSIERPVMHATASCVDYITGYLAALGIVEALVAREGGHGGSHVRTSLAMGTQLVQFPHMTRHADARSTPTPSGQRALGESGEQHLYKLADGWAFVGCRAGDAELLSRAVGAGTPSRAVGAGTPSRAVGATAGSVDRIAAAMIKLTLAQLRQRLAAVPGAAAVPVQSLAAIRARHTVAADTVAGNQDQNVAMPAGSFLLQRGAHPCGYPTTLPLPTWIRPDQTTVRRLPPAPFPGSDTIAVLKEAGYSDADIAALMAGGVIDTGWKRLRRYLPR